MFEKELLKFVPSYAISKTLEEVKFSVSTFFQRPDKEVNRLEEDEEPVIILIS